jgi:hypothetical protein
VVLRKALVDTRATRCKTQQLSLQLKATVLIAEEKGGKKRKEKKKKKESFRHIPAIATENFIDVIISPSITTCFGPY